VRITLIFSDLARFSWRPIDKTILYMKAEQNLSKAVNNNLELKNQPKSLDYFPLRMDLTDIATEY
jgi:hypothetical protein